MYGFSTILLEHTLKQASVAMPPSRDPRVKQYVFIIRHYMEWLIDGGQPEYYESLREAVSELSIIAAHHGESAIAERLHQIAEQLRSHAQRA